MELDWTTETVGGVTLVRVRLGNRRTVDRRVRLRNRLDGPVLPPRRQREPEAGWDRDGITAVVPAETSVAHGYACPAPDDAPPVEIAEVGSPAEADGDREETVSEAIRRLGDPKPPRAVLGEEPAVTGPKQPEHPNGRNEGNESDSESGTSTAVDSESEQPEVTQQSDLPPDVDTALEPYRTRIRTVETLGLASVAEATGLIETADGVAGVERTGEQLDADAATLRALAAEATALAARAEAATPPLDALRRLS